MRIEWLGRQVAVVVLLVAGPVLLSQCSDSDQGFLPRVNQAPPASMTVVSGDDQYSLHGSELPEPLIVEVRTIGGATARGVSITFRATTGGGTLSATSVFTNEKGQASTRLTLSTELGINRVAAVVDSDPDLFAIFEATSSNFRCREAEDTLKVCGGCQTSYGPKDDLFLVTRRSELYPDFSAGIVQIRRPPNPTEPWTAASFLEIPPDLMIFPPVIWDAAFSARGEYYIARRTIRPEILKVDVNGNVSRLVELSPDLPDEVEIATNSAGLLVGCDVRGPFIVRCPPDSILRFSEAIFADEVNNDALAVDPRRHVDNPLGEDIYFIHKPTGTLYRLPMDSLEVEPAGLQNVTGQLTPDQAEGARGMAVDDVDGSIYILVDTDNTKELLKVSTGGSVTQLFDFFSRGSGSAQDAGVQRDLAFRTSFLFTLDVLNDKLLAYDLLVDEFIPLFSDSLEQAKLSDRDSQGNPLAGEQRVGLDVLK